MFGDRSGSVGAYGGAFGQPIAYGVIWTPPEAKHRRVPLKTRLPGSRRGGGAHRRGRHVGQGTVPGAAAMLSGLTSFAMA